MLAAPVEVLPEGPQWAYEPKFDGWRAIATVGADGVRLQSRAGRPLGGYFPDITRALRAYLPAGVVLDGELIVWAGQRTNFALLQRRVTAGSGLPELVRRHPAHYVLFDLLRVADRELTGAPLRQRRAHLARLLSAAPAQLPLCPQTTDVAQARAWLADWSAAGIEGVVAKRLDGHYQPGQRGWYKLRARSGTEAVVGGVTGPVHEPETLLLGRFDTNGRLRYTGRTRPLGALQRRELGRALIPFGQRRRGSAQHPWPQPLPPSWSGQLQRPKPLPYAPVEPVTVVEIEVDTAYEHHRWRHPVRYRRLRPDVSVDDLPVLDFDE